MKKINNRDYQYSIYQLEPRDYQYSIVPSY